MARYNGRPKPSKPLRYEVALCGKDIFGVYDNSSKRFLVADVDHETAAKKAYDLNGAAFDRFLIGLAKKSFGL